MQTLTPKPADVTGDEPEAKPTSSEVPPNRRLHPTGRPSPKLAQMLADLTPEQVESAIAVAAKLLGRKAKMRA